MKFKKQSPMPVKREALFAYHALPGALQRLIPPWADVRIVRNDASIRDGARVELSQKIGPIRKRWIAEHFDFVDDRQFRDRQIRGPFKSWLHTHQMCDGPTPEVSVLADEIEYEIPAGAVGRWLLSRKIEREVDRMFRFRHARTSIDVTRHAEFADRQRLHVAVSGASGAIASNLIPFLTTGGHRVSRLVRDKSGDGVDSVYWDANTGDIDEAKLGPCDAVVHLAGKSIATRWTDRRKQEIWSSRVPATQKLCEQLARMSEKPKTLICASAIGYYGDRGEEILTESSPPGEGFAPKMCKAWENATMPARDAGIRVVNLRIGVVLSGNSGALEQMLTPARLGLAGPLAGGNMFMPWIAMDDLVGTFHACLMHDSVHGPTNAVTASVRQRDFIATLGRVINRPTITPMPAMAVNALFGQMGRELLLASANVQPTQIDGFAAMLPALEAALRFELGRG